MFFIFFFSVAHLLFESESNSRPEPDDDYSQPGSNLEMMMSFKRDFAQKFSINSQTSGDKTPSEFSVSIAGTD